MKILYIITKSEAGGAQTYVHQLSKYFDSKKNEVAIMAFPGGWLEQICYKSNIKFIPNKFFSNSYNPLKILKSIKKIQKIVKEFKPDLVHCNSSSAAFLARLIIRNKIPTVYTAHGWGFNIGVPFIQKQIAILAEKFVARYSSKIICVSDFVKRLGINYRIAKSDKFVTIYNGVEKKELVDRNYTKKIKLVFIGRLEEPKQPEQLIKALSQLPKNIQGEFELSIIGEGTKRQMLEGLIKEKEIKDVKILGELPREKVFDILQQSRLMVFLSKWEGFPMVILEAMSVGLPVVASDVGGISEVIQNKHNGFLVSDINHLVQILTSIAKEKNSLAKLGDNAIDSVRNKFSIEKTLSNTERVYKEVINL